jgi:hypothetical protein
MYFYEMVRDISTNHPEPETGAHTLGELEYQIRASDDKYLLFVTDLSKGARYIPLLDALVPKPITKVTENTRMWRVDRSVLKKLEGEVRQIATPGGGENEGPKLLAKYGKYSLYQYTSTTFALVGPKLEELKEDLEGLRGLGMNLKYGLGKGYVFPNVMLKKVEEYLVA